MRNLTDTKNRSADLGRLQPFQTSDNLPDQLATAISNAIITGDFRPGDRLHPDDIARHFDISKIPVREALRTVEANGWISSRPRRGTFVASPDLEELKHVFETRLLLEPGLAKAAAERRTDKQVKALKAVMDKTRRALSREDRHQIAECNSEFHELVAECAGNPFAKKLMTQVELRIRWYFANVPLGRSRTTIGEHSAIFDAIAVGDPEAAEAATRTHLRNTLDVALSGASIVGDNEEQQIGRRPAERPSTEPGSVGARAARPEDFR